MSSFAPAAKRQKTETSESQGDHSEFFHGIDKIKYEGANSTNPLAFKFYNPDEVIHGKPMKDWLRFSVCYWHTFRGNGSDPFGFPTMTREYEDGSDSLENAKRRLRAAFEFFSKLGVEFWCFHDRDIAPAGATWEETNSNLDIMADLALELQKKTGVSLLWGTANLFSHPRYMCGASSNPDFDVFACAAAQVKKILDVTAKLGGSNFVFWNGRDGYQTILNTDVEKELSHVVAFYKMAVKYAEKIGFKGQFLIEPKPREPLKHQYDYDAQTTIGFLTANGLDKHFKLNIEPNHTTLAGHDYEHDIVFASKLGMLGSIDSNSGDPLLGWDTDQFPSDPFKTALIMKAVLEQGGLNPGGLNFDCKLRRESTDLEDMFIGHIGAMDCYAKGLRIAAQILIDGKIPKMIQERYQSWDKNPLALSVVKGEATLEDLEKYAHQHEPKLTSGKQEYYEMVYRSYDK
eukprot:c13522_g1_i1.p1 GENE.c13522_g1_i1~~c13522_g1_i1.p1  ORF type:complete len:459 (+),score=227.37 c13522_g1_i1:50-1426(+)